MRRWISSARRHGRSRGGIYLVTSVEIRHIELSHGLPLPCHPVNNRTRTRGRLVPVLHHDFGNLAGMRVCKLVEYDTFRVGLAASSTYSFLGLSLSHYLVSSLSWRSVLCQHSPSRPDWCNRPDGAQGRFYECLCRHYSYLTRLARSLARAFWQNQIELTLARCVPDAQIILLRQNKTPKTEIGQLGGESYGPN